MPSLSERIASHQSPPTGDSTVGIPTNPVSIPTMRETRNHPPVNGCTLVGPHPCILSSMRRENVPAVVPTLRVDPASGEIVPYRAPWRDNLRARDETGL